MNFDEIVHAFVSIACRDAEVSGRDALIAEVEAAVHQCRVVTPSGDTTARGMFESMDQPRSIELLQQLVGYMVSEAMNERATEDAVSDLRNVPPIIYKYLPCRLVSKGAVTRLRSTQPGALNDVAESSIMTPRGQEADDREWFQLINTHLQQAIGQGIPAEELTRRTRLYGDPMVGTTLREHLSERVGVISFSEDPLVPTMWAHYAEETGIVVGYDTETIRTLGMDMQQVAYRDAPPSYEPSRGNAVRVLFHKSYDEKEGRWIVGSPYHVHAASDEAVFFEICDEIEALSKVLFVKSSDWASEKEVRLLVDQTGTERAGKHRNWPLRLLKIPREAVKEVYVWFRTSNDAVQRVHQLMEGQDHGWAMKWVAMRNYRMEVTSTTIY